MIDEGRWRLAVAGIVTIALLLVPGTASAQETDDIDDAQVIIDALTAAGVPPELIDEDFHQRVRALVRELVEDGVIEQEAIGELREVVREGRLSDVVEDRVDRGRERRESYRETAEQILSELGVELAEGQSAREALRDAGYDNDEMRDLLPGRRHAVCDLDETSDCGRDGDRPRPDGRPDDLADGESGRDRTRRQGPQLDGESDDDGSEGTRHRNPPDGMSDQPNRPDDGGGFGRPERNGPTDSDPGSNEPNPEGPPPPDTDEVDSNAADTDTVNDEVNSDES